MFGTEHEHTNDDLIDDNDQFNDDIVTTDILFNPTSPNDYYALGELLQQLLDKREEIDLQINLTKKAMLKFSENTLTPMKIKVKDEDDGEDKDLEPAKCTRDDFYSDDAYNEFRENEKKVIEQKRQQRDAERKINKELNLEIDKLIEIAGDDYVIRRTLVNIKTRPTREKKNFIENVLSSKYNDSDNDESTVAAINDVALDDQLTGSGFDSQLDIMVQRRKEYVARYGKMPN